MEGPLPEERPNFCILLIPLGAKMQIYSVTLIVFPTSGGFSIYVENVSGIPLFLKRNCQISLGHIGTPCSQASQIVGTYYGTKSQVLDPALFKQPK